MSEKQRMIIIEKGELISRVTELRDAGYRLTQLGCTTLDVFEINYSFEKDYEFVNLRLRIPREGAELPSISGIFWSAFLYENEIHDLFGINIKDIALDYKGNFYRLKKKAPMSTDDRLEQ